MRELSQKTLLIYLDIGEAVGMLRTDQARPRTLHTLLRAHPRILRAKLKQSNYFLVRSDG